MLALCLSYVVAGLVIAGVCVPLIQRRIPPNRWYGFRVRRTLSTARVWYEGNAYAGRRLFAAGLLTAAAPLLLLLLPGLSLEIYAILCLLVASVAILGALAQSFLYLRTL